MRDIRELGCRVIAPDRDTAKLIGAHLERLRELADGAVVVEPRERGESIGGNVASGCRGDERIRVRRVAHHHDTHIVRRGGADRCALGPEDARVRGEQVSALHARTARSRADQHRDIAAVEGNLSVIAHLDIAQQREGAVLQFERSPLGGAHPLWDLEQPQPHGSVGSEHVARGDAEEECVADLAARSGDGDGRRRLIHGQSLLRCQAFPPGPGRHGTVCP